MQESMVNGLSSTLNYNYDIANRLATANGVAYTYDDNGNLLNDGANTYAYDSANRLSLVSSDQGVESSYLYNGLGDRLSQNGVNYTLDLNTGLTQVLSDGTTSYTYGLGRISQQSGTMPEYFLSDALGSIRQMTDQAGAITYAASYDPYGVVTQSGGAGQSAYGYTGEQQDASGLVYLRARYYNPADGRFITRDSWQGSNGKPISYNRWLYASANPVRFVDPTGFCVDQPDSPRRCIVESGDNTWNIAFDRGLDFNTVVAWNKIVYGNDWNPRLIYAGQTIYLEDPSLGQPVIPTPSHPGELFNGYIEGTGFTFVALFGVLHAEGKEVIYDFESLQRAEVTYQGEPVFLGLFCGLSTDLLGFGKSWYTGFFHFPLRGTERDIESYGGVSGSISVGTGGINPLSGPLGAYDVGGQATAFISAGGDPILGIPTATNYGRVGATISVSEGVSVGRLPVNVHLMFLNYQIGPVEQYYSVEAMQQDIAAGKGTEFGMAHLTGLVIASRMFFWNQLGYMYTP